MTLKLTASFMAKPGKNDALREALRALIEPTRQEAACLRYELWRDRADPNHFIFIEEWESEAAHAVHVQMPYIQAMLLHLPELAVSEPKVNQYSGVG